VHRLFKLQVDRLCRVRSGTIADVDPFPTIDGGFLDPSAARAASSATIVPGALVDPDVAARAGAFVLLGEPGIGKTTVFQRLAARREEAPTGWAADPPVVVNAADLIDDSSFWFRLGRHLQPTAAGNNRHAVADTERHGSFTDGNRARPLTIIIDQLDESPLIQHVARRLEEILDGHDTSWLRLFVGCRTADYPATLTEVLTSAFGECVVADLAPLTHDDAVRLASSTDQVDGSALIAAAVQAGMAALASTPLTLELLVRNYAETRSLKASPAELFDRAIMQLLDEHNDGHRVIDQHSSVIQRKVIAQRIAAHLLLAGRRTIWRGSVLGSGEHDLNADGLAGGHEHCPSGLFDVTKPMVSATLSTGLFTGRGESRMAFLHGSYASYLTARYLLDREVPTEQLATLFLVSGGDDARSIPAMLREAAAWLVALDPAGADWLVNADPESLVAYSHIVNSDRVRELTVDGLLRSAPEIEVGNLPWADGSRFRLRHPGLDAQLLAVLGGIEGEPENWPSRARMRLAVRLARESGAANLAGHLLDIAESSTWTTDIRLMAGRAAYDLDAQMAAPRLVALLDRFADIGFSDRDDPDDEFRGFLLKTLWPRHIKVARVLPHLHRRKNRKLFGVYLAFQRSFPSGLADDDVGAVLRWAVTREQAASGDPESSARSQADMPSHDLMSRLDSELVESIADRALLITRAPDHVDAVASLLWPRLQNEREVTLPVGADLQDVAGLEPASSVALRRSLALSFVRLAINGGMFGAGEAWRIVSGWQRRMGLWQVSIAIPDDFRLANRALLLSPADFTWIHQTAWQAHAAGDSDFANALSQITVLLYNPADASHGELVYAHQDHPVWQNLRSWFDTVSLDASHARPTGRARAYEHNQAPILGKEPSAFAAELNELLQKAADGQRDAFLRLAWNLQFDLSTGQGLHTFHDNLLDLPGVAALTGAPLSELLNASAKFLMNQQDYPAVQPGVVGNDKRAWAGYLAFALLERHGRLTDLPEAAWAAWTRTLVWFPTMHGSEEIQGRKGKLLALAYRNAPGPLCDAVIDYIRGRVATGIPVSEAALIDPAWGQKLADQLLVTLEEIADKITSPAETDPGASSDDGTGSRGAAAPAGQVTENMLDAWDAILTYLDNAEDERALAVAWQWAKTRDNAAGRPLSARAIRFLLRTDARANWPQVKTGLDLDKDFAREVALVCATGDYYRPLLGNADEEQLGGAYRWLAELFPPEDDVYRDGFQGPEVSAWQWRDQILNLLSRRETEQAVVILDELRKEQPERLIIYSCLMLARSLVFAAAWSPPRPEELASFLADSTRRLVRSEHELAELVIEILSAIQKDLPGHSELLWDRLPRMTVPDGSQLDDQWQPKPEAALSAYLAHELSLRLRGRGVAVGREVLVQPTDAYGAGDRTDILIEATMRHKSLYGPTSCEFRVVLEVKGIWNKNVTTDMRQQLAERYLPEVHSGNGIYVIGCYPVDLWTALLEQWTGKRDDRRGRAKINNSPELLNALSSEAASIRTDLSVVVRPFLLNVTRPHKLPRVP
jgi:hypothetical protein